MCPEGKFQILIWMVQHMLEAKALDRKKVHKGLDQGLQKNEKM